MHRLAGIAVLATLLFGASTARGQQDLVGVRALGMGEAQRATATGAEGPLINPAGMSLIKQYVVEGMYGFHFEPTGHAVNIAIVDSITARVAAGLFYSFIYEQPKVAFNWAGGFQPTEQLTRTGHVAGLSLSMPLGEHFILGATIKYLHISTVAPLPQGSVPSTITFDSVNGITFDVALLLRLGDKFNMTAIGYNLWDHGSRESPLSLGIGLAYVPLPSLSINFDTVINFTGNQNLSINPMTMVASTSQRTTARLGPGLEYLIAHKVPLRAGVVWDSTLPATYVTGGLGYLATAFAIDLSYRGRVQGGVDNLLMLGLRIFVN